MAGQYDLNLSNGSIFATLQPLETNGPNNVSTPRLIQEIRPQYLIAVVTSGTNTFSIVGDFTNVFRVGFIFQVANSTGNNGTYTVQSVSFSGGNTQITTVENFTDNTLDGSIIAHAFRLVGDMSTRFVAAFSFTVQNSGDGNGTYVVEPLGSFYEVASETTIIPVSNGSIRDNLIAPIVLPYGEIIYTNFGTVSSLQLPGRGTVNYGEKLIENALRITEHFAADDAPNLNASLGLSPAATPLIGQLWYNTTAGSEGFNVWDGSAWTSDNDLDTGALIFRDLESTLPAAGTADIYLTASETNLPAGYLGTNEPGFVIWTETDQANNTAIFRVLSQNGNERLRVEHSSVANAAYIRTINNLDIQATGESYFYGQVGIGDSGLPTIERTLSVEGNGISVNSDGGLDARLVLDAPTGQVASVDFEINNVPWGNISADGSNFLINSATAIDVAMVTGGGDVGINQLSPSARLDVVGTTELNGKTNVVSADFIVGIDGTGTEILSVDDSNSWVGISTAIVDATDVTDAMEITGNLRINSQIFASVQSAAAPTYSFTSDPDTGMFSGGTNIIAFATNGTLAFSINASGVLQVPSGYESSVVADTDIPNKAYVDDRINGISWREPARVRDNTASANEAAFPTTGTIDGVTLVDGDRVLFSSTVVLADRDVFIWNATGSAWVADVTNPQTIGDAVYVMEGISEKNVYAFSVSNQWELVGAGPGINVQYENQVASASQLVFNLATVKYSIGTNRIQIYVDGVKQIVTLAYAETDPQTVTFVGPSPFVGGEVVEFIAWDELTANAVAKREQQTGLVGTPVINFATITYQVNSDNLLVFVNGQKMIKDIDYTETTDSSITWIGTPLVALDILEFYSSVPIVAGTKLRDIDDVSTATPTNGDLLSFNSSTGLWEPTTAGASTGSPFDYIVGVTGTVITLVNVSPVAKTGTNSFVQVFLNGILQREDVAGFGATGNFYVSSGTQLTFATALVATDEVLVYGL